MLIEGPAAPTPLDAYFRPLRVQKISAVSRPRESERNLISNRIISSSFLLHGRPGLTPGLFLLKSHKLRLENLPNPLQTESCIDSAVRPESFSTLYERSVRRLPYRSKNTPKRHAVNRIRRSTAAS